MKKLLKYGLLLIVVSLLILFGLGLSAQKAYATEETLTTSAYPPAKNPAITAYRNAVDEIKKYPVLSDQYKAAVKEARRLADKAVLEGATIFELCTRRLLLEEAEYRIARGMATPVTGGFPVGVILGLMFLGSGVFFYRKAS